jgi:hypothetical protein
VEQSLHQLPYLFQLSHDFEANMHACLAAAIVPGVLIIGGAYLKLVGIAGSLGDLDGEHGGWTRYRRTAVTYASQDRQEAQTG